jgi:hypothetical protein
MIICGVHGLEPAKDYCDVGDCLRLDIDIPVMQKQCKSVKAGLQKKTVEKKKGRKDVKYLGNVANGVNILLANRIGDQERQATCL